LNPVFKTGALNHSATLPTLQHQTLSYRSQANVLATFGHLGHMLDKSRFIAAEEILSYHRGEGYKIVRLRDDLISAVRCAFMMSRHGKLPSDCESYGRARGMDDGARYDPRPWNTSAERPRSKSYGSFDLFTGVRK
jgi:hypothetical protein